MAPMQNQPFLHINNHDIYHKLVLAIKKVTASKFWCGILSLC